MYIINFRCDYYYIIKFIFYTANPPDQGQPLLFGAKSITTLSPRPTTVPLSCQWTMYLMRHYATPRRNFDQDFAFRRQETPLSSRGQWNHISSHHQRAETHRSNRIYKDQQHQALASHIFSHPKYTHRPQVEVCRFVVENTRRNQQLRNGFFQESGELYIL